MTSSISCYPASPSAKCHLLAGDKTINCVANYPSQPFAPEGHTCYQREMFLPRHLRERSAEQSLNRCHSESISHLWWDDERTTTASSSRLLIILLSELEIAFCPAFCHRENLSLPLLKTRTHAQWHARGNLQGFLPSSYCLIRISAQCSDEKHLLSRKLSPLGAWPSIFYLLFAVKQIG